MGLDQYINCKGASHPYNLPLNGDHILDNPIELWYGRKEWEIHNWMQKLFVHKGGDPALPFNLESYVVLDEFDMDDFLNDISSDEFKDVDIQLLSEYRDLAYKIKRLVQKGNTVYYTSWW
jgi:hypothetical protein